MKRIVRLGIVFVLCACAVSTAQNTRIMLQIDPMGTQDHPIMVEIGKTVHFTAKAFEYTDPAQPPHEVQIGQLVWSVDPSFFGLITPAGDFTANPSPQGTTLARGRVVATATVGAMTLTASSELKLAGTGSGGDQHNDFSFSGIVVDDNGNPIPNAEVHALATNVAVPPNLAAKTNDSGRYTLRVPQGVYYLQAAAPGFLPEYYDNAATLKQATALTTDPAAKDVTGIDFSLALGGTIAGTVTDAADGHPLADARVVAFPAGANPQASNGAVFQGMVMRDGSYSIGGLPAGDYIVEAMNTAYGSVFYDGKTDYASADHVTVQAGATQSGIDFSLNRIVIQPPTLYPISGTVHDENGSSVDNALVIAESRTAAGGALKRFAVQVAHGGSYTMLVPADTYVVSASAPGFMAEYFNNVPDAASATAVTVDANTPEQRNVDFSLGHGGIITGRVTRASDQSPIEHAWVAIATNGTNVPPTSGVYGYGAYTDANGDYTISGLTGGEYVVVCRADGFDIQFYNGVNDPTQATKVAVTLGQTTSGIDFALAAIPGVSGIVTDAVTALPIPGAAVVFEGGGMSMTAMTAKDGSFQIHLPAGTYKAHASAMQYAPEWYDEQSDPMLADDIVVAAGQNVEHIDFTLDHWGGSISGTVTDENGTGIGDAMVHAWASAAVPGANVRRYFASGRTNPDGTYILQGVPPGTYYVNAGAKDFIGEFYDNAADLAQATEVTVTNGQNTSGIDFALAHGGSITGQVTDAATGAPIANAFVQLRNATSLRDQGARTDQSGMYTIGGLATGSYVVLAIAPHYLPEYYDNVADPANATQVQVTAPNTTTGIDFSLDIAPFRKSATQTYTGRVFDRATGEPLLLSVIEAIDPVAGTRTVTTVDAGGRFQISCNESAVLRARAVGYVGAYAGDKRNWEESTKSPNGDIAFSLDPLSETGFATLTGVVSDATARTAIPDAWVFGTDADANVFFSYSDSYGRFAIDGTSEGAFDVLLSTVQYVPSTAGASVEGASGSMQINGRKNDTPTGTTAPPAPTAVTLSQNYPNPFNPSTTIAFTVPANAHVSLKVYNLLGDEVATLVDGTREAGTYRILWNASSVSSGVYLYKLQADGKTITRQMTLLK